METLGHLESFVKEPMIFAFLNRRAGRETAYENLKEISV